MIHKISCAKGKSGICAHKCVYHNAESGPSIKNAHLKTALLEMGLRRKILNVIPTVAAKQKLKNITKDRAKTAKKKRTIRTEEDIKFFSFCKFSCDVTKEKSAGIGFCF